MTSSGDPDDPSPSPRRSRLASAALRVATQAVDAAAAQRWRDTATILTLRSELAAQAALIQRQADALADMTRIFDQALDRASDQTSAGARIGLWHCDLPDETLRWSEGVYDLFEFPRGSRVSRADSLACYTEEARRHLVAVRSEALGRRTPFGLDAEIVAHRGSRRWIRITGSVDTRAGVPVRLFGFKQDITEQTLSAARARYRAEFDRMTGLANRSVFDEHLARVSESGALLLVDLDGFKAINDTYGHAVGDVCLQEAARRLRAACVETDLVARIGGDEFAVLVTRGADGPFCEAIGRRIVTAMRDPYRHGGLCLRFGASVGIARAAVPAQADLFTRADAALYAAKAAGRGTLRMALPR